MGASTPARRPSPARASRARRSGSARPWSRGWRCWLPAAAVAAPGGPAELKTAVVAVAGLMCQRPPDSQFASRRQVRSVADWAGATVAPASGRSGSRRQGARRTWQNAWGHRPLPPACEVSCRVGREGHARPAAVAARLHPEALTQPPTPWSATEGTEEQWVPAPARVFCVGASSWWAGLGVVHATSPRSRGVRRVRTHTGPEQIGDPPSGDPL